MRLSISPYPDKHLSFPCKLPTHVLCRCFYWFPAFYILETNPSLVVWLTNTFSHGISAGCGVQSRYSLPLPEGLHTHLTHWWEAWPCDLLWSIKGQQKWCDFFFLSKSVKGHFLRPRCNLTQREAALSAWILEWRPMEQTQGQPTATSAELSLYYHKPRKFWCFLLLQKSWTIERHTGSEVPTIIKHKTHA